MKKIYLLALLCVFTCISIKAQVAINEVYGGGGNAGAPYTNDFVELYNNGASAVTMNSWSIQYSSATGTSWGSNKTTFSGTIPANGYFLIQLASGTNGVALPTPNATGTTNLSGTAGKLVLCNDNVNVSAVTNPTDANILDKVGYGSTANGFETAFAPSPSNTTSIQRTPVGTDNNNNSSDFTVGSPSPTNSGLFVTINIAAGTTPSEPSTSGNFTISISAAQATNTPITYSVSGTAGTGTDYTALSGTATITTGNTSVLIPVAVIDDAVSDPSETIVITLGTPPSGFSNGTSTATLTIFDNESIPQAPTRISTVQGSSATASGGTLVIEGIVTGVFPNLSPAGFYVQEEDADADGNPLTSEAIYVVTETVVNVGDRVSVGGTVQENGSFPSFNQGVITPVTTISVINNNIPLPTAVSVNLPLSSATALEAVEGMRVRFPQTLYVTDNSTTHRFGEVLLSSSGPLTIPTQVIDPNDDPASGTSSSGNSNVAAVTAQQTTNSLNQIILDDAKGGALNEFPATVPYFNPVTKTIRLGDNVTGLSGVMTYSFSAYRVQPPGALPSFTYTSRPITPSFPAADVTAASFNVLNYFNGDGAGGGFPTARGASTPAEFTRQRNKIIAAIMALNADVVGLIELENDGTGPNSAIQDLVNGLNTAMGAGSYALVNDGASIQPGNGDAIRCGIIYKSSKLTADAGGLFFTNTFIYTGSISTRPSIAQVFTTVGTGKKFAFVVNHFKSKGGTGTGANADQGDGQSAFNNVRKQETQNLLTLVNGTLVPITPRVLMVGDFNAYQEEDPMDLLRANGYTVLAEGQNSYEFNGQLGALDHAVVTPGFNSLVLGSNVWNINSTEPLGLDYEDDLITAGEDAANRRQPYLYTVDPYSSSDHDPILIGLSLPVTLPIRLVDFSAEKRGNGVKLGWTTSQEINTKEFIIEHSTDGIRFQKLTSVAAAGNSSASRSYQAFDAQPASGNNYYRLKTVDIDGSTELSRVVKIHFGKAFTVSLSPNPALQNLVISITNSREPVLMELLDMTGKRVQRATLLKQQNTISVGGLSKGLYLVRLQTATAVYTEKLVIE